MIAQNDPDEKLVSTQDISLKNVTIILCSAISSLKSIKLRET